jgi:type IV pilus assembly protein PilO
MMSPADLSQYWRERILRHPASWPKIAQSGLALLCFFIPLLISWQTHLANSLATLQQTRQQELQQQTLYQKKWPQAAPLSALQARKKILAQRLEQRQQQLFDNNDSGNLIGTVATLAAHCHLALEHARPGTSIRRTSHTVVPLHLRLRGGYHDIGCFAAAIAASSRPLTLADLQLSRTTDDQPQLSLEAALLTYHLHTSELQP